MFQIGPDPPGHVVASRVGGLHVAAADGHAHEARAACQLLRRFNGLDGVRVQARGARCDWKDDENSPREALQHANG